MSRKILSALVIPGVILCVGACAQQGQQEATPAAEPAAEAMTEAAPMDAAPMELTAEKVTEIAQLVVHMAQNPEQAAEMLEQHGMTQEALDAALAQIEANPDLKSVYDQAKASAEQMSGTMGAAEGETAGH